ncbi:DUF397 domain-containing protein [Nocardia asteroides]
MNVALSGARWFTSTRTSGGKDCVEVAHLAGGMVGVRDSTNSTGPAVILTPGAWDAFTADVVSGAIGRL